MGLESLTRIKGIGPAKAAGLVAAFALSRRALYPGIGIAPSILRPADVVSIVANINDRRKENFVAVFLNARNQVIWREDVPVGSLNASLVHPREVFLPAVGVSAASVILAHNHPSGDVTPNREDIELTRRMVQAGEIMGIEVLDHIIVGVERFLSMKYHGLLRKPLERRNLLLSSLFHQFCSCCSFCSIWAKRRGVCHKLSLARAKL